MSALCLLKKVGANDMTFAPTWYARRDSNPQPSEPESDALSNCATGARNASLNALDYYSNLFRVCKEPFLQKPCEGRQSAPSHGFYFSLIWNGRPRIDP